MGRSFCLICLQEGIRQFSMGLLVSVCLASRSTDWFYSGVFFKGVCMIENIETRWCPTQEQRAGLLRVLQDSLLEQRALEKIWVPCAHGSSPVTQLSSCINITWPSLHCPGGVGAGDQNKKMILWILLWVMKSFASDPGISCLLAPTKLCQTNLLACK